MNITWHSAAPERFRLTVFKEGQPLQDPIGPGPWVGAWLWIYSPHTREDGAGWVRAAHGFRRNGKVELRSPIGLLATIEDASDFIEVEDIAPFADAARVEPLERVEGLGNIPFIGDFFAAPVPGGLLPRSSYAQMALDNAAQYTEQERHALYARGEQLQPSDDPLNQFVAAAIVPSRMLSYRSDRPYRTGRSTSTEVIDQWDTPCQAPFPLHECAADCEEFAQISFQTAVKLGPPAGYEACIAVVVLSDGKENVMHAMAVCVDQAWLRAHWDNPANTDAAKLPHVPLDGVERSRAVPVQGELPTHVHYPFLVALLRADGMRILMRTDAVAGVAWGDTAVHFVSHCDAEEQQRRRWAGAELVRKYMPAAHAETRVSAGTAGRYNDSALSVVGKGALAHLREFHLSPYATADAFIRDDRDIFPSRRGLYDVHFALETIWGRRVETDVVGGFDYFRNTLRDEVLTDPSEYTMSVFNKNGKVVVAIGVNHWRRGTEAERDAEMKKDTPDFREDVQLFADNSFLMFTGVVQPFFVTAMEFKTVYSLLAAEGCEIVDLSTQVAEPVREQWGVKARAWKELAYDASLKFRSNMPLISSIEVKDSTNSGIFGLFRNPVVELVEGFVKRLKLPTGVRDEPVLQIEVANTPDVSAGTTQDRRLLVITTSAFIPPTTSDPNRLIVTKASADEFSPVFLERCLMRIIGSIAGFGGSVVPQGTPLGLARQPSEWASPEGRLRTYGFMSSTEMRRVPSYLQLIAGVSATVESTGLARDDSNPDVAIVFHVPLSNQLPEFIGVETASPGWPIPWRPPAGKYRMLVVVVVRDHTNSVKADAIPYMARQRAELVGKAFDLTGVFVKCVDVSNREARDSDYVAELVKGLLPVVRNEPDKVVVTREEDKVPAPVAIASAASPDAGIPAAEEATLDTGAAPRASTGASDGDTIQVAIRAPRGSVLLKHRPDDVDSVAIDVFRQIRAASPGVLLHQRKGALREADGVLYFFKPANEVRIEWEADLIPTHEALLRNGAKHAVFVICRRNEGPALLGIPSVDDKLRERVRKIPNVYIDIKKDLNDVWFLHPANGPRYKELADAIRAWRGAPRAAVDAPAAAEVVQRPPVRAEPPPVQSALPPPQQPAPAPPPAPRRGPRASRAIVYAIVNDPTGGAMKRGITKRLVGEQRLVMSESQGVNTDFLIAFATKRGSWSDVSFEISRVQGEWIFKRFALVVVHVGDEKGDGNPPDSVTRVSDFTGDVNIKDGVIRDQRKFDQLLDRLAGWITLTLPNIAPDDDAVETVPLPRVPDNGRPLAPEPPPEPDNGRPYVPSPFEPDNGSPVTLDDLDVQAPGLFMTMSDVLGRAARRATGRVTPTRRAHTPPPRLTASGPVSPTASWSPIGSFTSNSPVSPLTPVAAVAVHAHAAPVHTVAYDPFDDVYDGGHTMRTYYTSVGRALAARLTTE